MPLVERLGLGNVSLQALVISSCPRSMLRNLDARSREYLAHYGFLC
jgi:hypothetical protein